MGSSNVDTITGYSKPSDDIQLGNDVLTALTTTWKLGASAFVARTVAGVELAFLTISLSATRLAQNDIPPALLVLLISAIVAGLAVVTGLASSGLALLFQIYAGAS